MTDRGRCALRGTVPERRHFGTVGDWSTVGESDVYFLNPVSRVSGTGSTAGPHPSGSENNRRPTREVVDELSFVNTVETSRFVWTSGSTVERDGKRTSPPKRPRDSSESGVSSVSRL